MLLSRRVRALLLLTCQNATIALLTRQSRLGNTEELYLPSSAVLLAEIIKATLSWATLAIDYYGLARSKRDTKKHEDDVTPVPVTRPLDISMALSAAVSPMRDAFTNEREDLLKLAVPAALYAGQNNLLYIALSNLSAALYQVTYQMRILSTAIASLFFLGRRYSVFQWAALSLLTAGVAVVQMPSYDPTSASAPGGASLQSSSEKQSQLVGFSAIFMACISSAIAGCYFEAILKPSARNSKAASPIAMQNLQLALVSIPFDLLAIFLPAHDRARVLKLGFFHGYSLLSYFVVLNQAVGGLLIAQVVKEADSVSKGFATSLAVILSTIISSTITKSLPNIQFVFGAGCVIAATAAFAAL